MKRIATLQLNVLGLVSVNNAGFDYDLLPAQQVLPSPPPVLKRRWKRHYYTRLQTQVTYFINRSPSRFRAKMPEDPPPPPQPSAAETAAAAALAKCVLGSPFASQNPLHPATEEMIVKVGPMSYPKPDFFVK